MAKDVDVEAQVKKEVRAQLQLLAGHTYPDDQPPKHVQKGLTDTATAAAAGTGGSLLISELLHPDALLDHGTVGVIVYGVLAVALVAAGVLFGWIRSRQD